MKMGARTLSGLPRHPLRSTGSPSQIYHAPLADGSRHPRRSSGDALHPLALLFAISSAISPSGAGQAAADKTLDHPSPAQIESLLAGMQARRAKGWIFNDHLVEELAGMTAKR